MSVALAGAQVCNAIYNFVGSTISYLRNSPQPKLILKTTPVALASLKNFAKDSLKEIGPIMGNGAVISWLAIGAMQSSIIGILTAPNHPYVKVGYLGFMILMCGLQSFSCCRNVRNVQTGQKEMVIFVGATLGALSDFQNRIGFVEHQKWRNQYSVLPEGTVIHVEFVGLRNAMYGAMVGDAAEHIFTVGMKSFAPVLSRYKNEVAIFYRNIRFRTPNKINE